MSGRTYYRVEDEQEEAEAAARELPQQIERVRAHVRQAKAALLGGRKDEATPSDRSKP